MGFGRLALVCVSLAACSAQSSVGVDADTTPGPPWQDASFLADSGKQSNPDSSALDAVPLIYAVHAGPADLPAFRLCLGDATPPLPSDPSHPMPLSNFPGVGVGSMAELGSFSGNFPQVTLFSAFTLKDSMSAAGKSCGELITAGAITAEQLGPITLDSSVQILVVSGASGARKLSRVSADGTTYGNGPQPMHFQVGHFSQSLSQAPIAAKFGTQGAGVESLGSPAFQTLAASVGVTGFPASPLPGDFDKYGVQIGAAFYSLSNIQAATDPTTTPADFFKSRLNGYALLLIDDVGKPTQHLVAVPLHP